MNKLQYVNVLQGTRSVPRYSNGNTLPLTQMPHGMAAFAPQTNGGAGNWWFAPDVPAVEGIRLTHQPSPWLSDYGTLIMTPQADVIKDKAGDAWSGYRMRESVLSPHYIKLGFLRARAVLELAPFERGASVRVTFGSDMTNCLSLFNILGSAAFQADEKTGMIYGVTDGSTNWPMVTAENFRMHIALRPKSDWVDYEKTNVFAWGKPNAGIHIMVKEGVSVADYDIGISYISREQAVRNCEEAAGKTLEEVKEACAASWEAHLSKIEIEETDEDILKTFYSCMYRIGIFPQKAHEIDGEGRTVHYSPYTGKVHKGVRYTGNGFWDTYRTVLPLFTLIDPELYRDFLTSMLSDYREGGWLPRWVVMDEVGCMPSTLGDSVIAQGIKCGLADEETARGLLEGMLRHANTPAPEERFGRASIESYLKYGYVPFDKGHESVNLTLDFAYGDYCIARIMEHIGETERVEEYLARGQRYRNLFDPSVGFMRAKDSDGNWREGFDPCAWGRDYTEGSAWQTTFSVPHDLEGLAELMGGREKLLEKLDALFAEKPIYRVTGYGIEIHEMTEMAAYDFGQCAMNNQPSFLIPYIYAYFGETEKSEYWVKRICKEAFSHEVDGFPGDEDNGTTAAWYVLSMLGYYPVCPADDKWVSIPAQVKGTICGVDIEEFKRMEN